jgi:CheY-like chemotaxis protein
MDSVVSVGIPRETIASQPVNILLVEDDLDTLTVYSRLLRMDGHIVHTADGYRAAMDVARRERVDLAVCDIRLWDGDGCDLLGELQKLQPMKAIAVTGFALPDEVEDYRAAGFTAVLPKPLEPSQLQSAISQLSSSINTLTQRDFSMNPTKNYLSVENRTPLAQLLKEWLTKRIDMRLQPKQAHWNVKGPTFNVVLYEDAIPP